MCRMHFDTDDRVSLRGFWPEDRQDLVNGLNDWAVTRWLGRVSHPYRRIDHANAFLALDEHLHVNEAVRDGSRSLSLALCADDDDVVLGVLSHALRQVMRSAVVAIGVSLLVGSEESILEEVAGFGGSLLLFENSRAIELETDHLSADWMEAIGRDPQVLVRFFEKIAKECGEICDGGSMLASHPSFSERIEALSE